MAPPPSPGLMDDLIGEILLRVPPEDPDCLVRASVVCKPWRRLLSDSGFPRRYCEFHRAPPLLGFFHNEYGGNRFIPIKEASPILNRRVRHGRVLLINWNGKTAGLVIWDPITNSKDHIGLPKITGSLYGFTAAVLCAVDGCDHLGCRGGPSLVVFVGIDNPNQQGARVSARVYSTETGAWNAGVSSVHSFGYIKLGCQKTIAGGLLAGDALYFILENGRRILKYDLSGSRLLSVMSPPPSLPVGNMVLMKAEGGGLGACSVEGQSLHLWAWRTGPRGISEWAQDRVIRLDIGHLSKRLYLVDFAEGDGSIFVRGNNSVFAVELKSGQATMIGKGRYLNQIFPFMSFYTPVRY